MQEQINQLLTKVQDLETLVKFLQTNLSDNIRTFWTILGFLVVSTGGALYFLVKSIVNSRVEKELTEIKKSLEKDLQVHVNALPFSRLEWASGNTVINTDGKVTITGLDIKDINAFKNFHIVEVTTIYGKKLNFDMDIKDNILALSFSAEDMKGIFQHGWAALNWKAIWLKEK